MRAIVEAHDHEVNFSARAAVTSIRRYAARGVRPMRPVRGPHDLGGNGKPRSVTFAWTIGAPGNSA